MPVDPLATPAALSVLPTWYERLEARHLSSLSFSEVRRAAEALSATYVARGQKLSRGGALEGRGKRAAFALLYGPLHFVLIAHIIDALGLSAQGPLYDVGCGTGVASAAWALSQPSATRPRVVGIDTNAWAVEEARWNWRELCVQGQGRVGRAEHVPLSQAKGIVAAFVLNEWPDPVRERFVDSLLEAHTKGASILIVEPVAKTAAPFWRELSKRLAAAGAQEQEHRVQPQLPERLALLRRASKRESRELTARSLSLQGS